jgi:hypothetical protein
MNSTTIITGLIPWQAMELVCLVYGADDLPVPGTTHQMRHELARPSKRSFAASRPSDPQSSTTEA